MKITDVRTTLLTGPCTNDPFLREARKRRSAAFIEIFTDGPHIGLGETYAGYFCPEAVPAIVDFFKPILVGQNVDDIPELWQRMYHCGNFWCRVGLGTIVLNGIEAALWDLKGKLLDQPVHALLGGALESLDRRERYIVEQRIMGDDDVSLADLGRELGVSRERARQLEARAKKKLHKQLREARPDVAELAVAAGWR